LSQDAYSIARYVRHYHAKNGFAPTRCHVGISAEEEAALVKNGIIELAANYPDGPKIYIVLTDKGRRMAEGRRR
jgi:hypothetical protein